MELKGSKTEQNIKASLQGESLARNKYIYYAIQARNEGLEETARFFEKMSENELAHGKIWFKLLNGGFGTTEKNLIESSMGENMEWSSMYPGFAKVAREEGFEEIAVMFERIAAIEKDHDRQFLAELGRLKAADNPSAKAEAESEEVEQVAVKAYRCQFCGHVHEDEDGKAPVVCPVCEAINAWDTTTIYK